MDASFVAVRPGATPTPFRSATVFGPLASLAAEPTVTDIFSNGADDLWVDRGAGLVRSPSPFPDEAALRSFAVSLIAAGGRHVDETTPCVDVRLQDGVRAHVVLPPVSTVGTLLSIRLPRITPLSLTDLDAAGYFSSVPLPVVLDLVTRRTNLLITGAAGAGKTTLLSALLSAASPHERIIAIEDVAELHPSHPHFISLETRQPNLEGAGGIELGRLLREALRMRPDRLVLGECRGPEVRELFGALNTGHDGGAGTMHANSMRDVPSRIEALGALAGWSPAASARQAASAIGAVLHVTRSANGRQLAELGRLVLVDDRLAAVPYD